MTPISRRAFVTTVASAVVAPKFANAETGTTRLRCRFADKDFTYRLLDNPTVRDFVSLLPLDLTIEDFSSNEKIAYLARRLDQGGHVPIRDEAPGDLCYFLGWGNLAFFHNNYEYRNDLIRLGKIEGSVAPLLVRGKHPLRLELTR